jgi:hypothetical protein
MSERGIELFDRLQSAGAIMALIGHSEDVHFDCKEWPASDGDAQKVFAKAACGLTNAEGGVILVGMRARPTPKDEPDLVESAVPVTDTSACRLSVDPFGIDGNHGFGLPQRPSDGQWITFGGGVDEVVYPEDVLKITKLFQRGDNKGPDGFPFPKVLGPTGQPFTQWVFKAITVQCEISCEGMPTQKVEKAIPEEVVINWPYPYE